MSLPDISSLLEAIPQPALLIGRAERIIGANSGASALLGGAITGRHFITAIRQPTVLDAIEDALRTHAPREARYLTNAGEADVTYTVTARPVDWGSMQAVLVCFEDITHLEQAGQMRRDFVANVSHELRTPLTALLGFIETLQGPAKGDAVATERFLRTMAREAARMERLVHDLLSLSRVEAQERVRPRESVDLGALLTSVCQTLRPLTQDAGAALALTLPDAAIKVPGDADQLRQVFTNLIENAVKYGGQGGAVRITLTQLEAAPALRRPAAAVTITDQGPGIDPLHIPRLTERFYRVDGHRSREKGGTGLGLAIVKHIINRHRGRLRIESALGKGSTFSVLLPLDV
ncbi:PAS domain-containing protein [Roseovarius sp. LXJ103]|uniref:sensor histidine kinase n=1 Tax=Roseovarius carneus TaxID=2853164 RepID=UPI000D60755F|nr:ATP-binding protein [Roseovarius carneus]MBZ8119358.1 PAS domain-containing protein [Roseovarius carneus]PWE35036.1 two-component sensor histidine kinase [Pelagicola sp. LXJ1103]